MDSESPANFAFCLGQIARLHLDLRIKIPGGKQLWASNVDPRWEHLAKRLHNVASVGPHGTIRAVVLDITPDLLPP